MIFLLFVVSLFAAAQAQAPGLAGTYQLSLPGGIVTLRLEVKGTALTGALEAQGQTAATLSGTVSGDKASGRAVSSGGEGSFAIALSGDVLRLTLSQEDGPQQRAGSLPMEFRRAGAAAAAPPPVVPPASPSAGDVAGDPRLVGDWSYQDVIVSGSASMASEERISFRADGTFVYAKGRSVAGGTDWSYDGGPGGSAERGRWRAQNGVLFVARSSGDWVRVGTYGMTEDGRTMRVIYDQGGRKLWSRR